MLERYSTQEMRELWSIKHKFEVWQEIEILACKYWYQEGKISLDDWNDIKTKAKFDVNRVLEIENEVQHDVIAFLTNLAEHIGPASRHVHFGLTSSDVGDTALSYIIKEAGELILKRYSSFLNVLREQAIQYKDLVTVGRTHGVHAEPTTLGLKLLGFYAEGVRNYNRFKQALEEASFGKISGAVGTYSQLPPELEAFVLKELTLNIEPVSTQVIPRDRHAHLLNAIALVGQGLARLAQEIRLLQKTESREVEEPFQKGQKGSSAMPHKRNPILCERICGLSRLLSGYAVAGLQNIPLWHERDISHSSAERALFPDATSLLEYMLIKMEFVVKNLHIYPDRCEYIMNATSGLLFSSRALLMITEELKISREEVYAIVQSAAMTVWSDTTKYTLKGLLMEHPLCSKIPLEKWDNVFNPKDYIKNVDFIFERLLK